MFQPQYNDVITIEDLCEMLLIGKSTAYRLLRNHDIPAFKIGRIWKIPRESVTAYINTHTLSL